MLMSTSLDTHHVVVVLGDGGSTDKLVGLTNEFIIKRGVKRLFVHVISQDGRPKYFERFRNVLQSLIHCSLIIKYEGSTTNDFIRLVKSTHDLSKLVVVLVGEPPTELKDFLKGLGINYISV
ncbi:MAG: hypothetical protein LM560_03070 [Desulfurococcaceae archaeon]|jgi:hypothetical protein|nr:hypothetical protein [Desulfurococcaceae archaeon]